ncbi:restriction endonuclease subunit S [Castellaniella sp.]|uniref:restriction endonuclease subunit S n=1 Tax=Castellaniella sp. TaxID=1955812 RepID=UPI002AFFABB0|nr:restriction endonuclease subunit S [Castellaniella sp.]
MSLKTESLASMCEAVIDCPHSTPVWSKSGYVVLRNKNIKDGRLDLSEPSFTDGEHFKQRIRRMAPQPGDIVITREAPMGEVCKIPEGLTCCLGQRQVLLRPKADVDADYLLYALQSPFVQNQIRWNEGTGSTVSNIRIPVLEKIEIPRHDQAETSIAKALGSLDSKIDLNRHINQTLEAMAKVIFKSWFVDFDPVKAKMAAIEQGQDPLRAAMCAISGKTDAELDQIPREQHDQLATTAALFPETMEESELGEIPQGWEEKSLDQIASYLNGLALQKFPPESEDEYLSVIKIAQLRAGYASGADRASKNIKPEYIVQDGDVLFSWSGSLEVDVWTGGVGALNQHLFKITSESVPKWFYYFATKHYLPQFREIAADKATTMGHIQRKHLSDAKTAVPKPDVMRAASENISPIFNQVISLRLQSGKLADLRDALLPKLLSGELAIGKIVGLADTTGAI